MKFIGLSTVGLVALISPPRNVQSSTIRGRRILMRNNPDVPTDKNNRGLVEFKDYGSNPVSRYPLGLCEGDVSISFVRYDACLFSEDASTQNT